MHTHTRRRGVADPSVHGDMAVLRPRAIVVGQRHGSRGRIDSRAGKERETGKKRSRQVSRQGKREITRRPRLTSPAGPLRAPFPRPAPAALAFEHRASAPCVPPAGRGTCPVLPAPRAWRGRRRHCNQRRGSSAGRSASMGMDACDCDSPAPSCTFGGSHR